MAGLFVASANAASGRATMGWFGARERGLALGIRQASMPVGVALSGLLLPALAASGTRTALTGLAIVLVVAAIAAAALLRPPPTSPSTAANSTPLRDRDIWSLAEASALLVVVQFAFLGFLTLYLHDERGFSAGAAAATLAGSSCSGPLPESDSVASRTAVAAGYSRSAGSRSASPPALS